MAIGRKTMAKKRQNKRGFSLMEVMLVLALIVLVVSLLVVNFDSLFKGFAGGKSFQSNLESVIRTARYTAYRVHTPVYLEYDAAKRCYLIADYFGKELKSVKTRETKENAPKGVTFYSLEPEKSFHGEKLPFLTFSSDGSSNRAVIECSFEGYQRMFKLEPFNNELVKFP